MWGIFLLIELLEWSFATWSKRIWIISGSYHGRLKITSNRDFLVSLQMLNFIKEFPGNQCVWWLLEQRSKEVISSPRYLWLPWNSAMWNHHLSTPKQPTKSCRSQGELVPISLLASGVFCRADPYYLLPKSRKKWEQVTPAVNQNE